jgi:hypothetical protein
MYVKYKNDFEKKSNLTYASYIKKRGEKENFPLGEVATF